MRFSPLDSSEDFMGRGGLRFSLSLIVSELWRRQWRHNELTSRFVKVVVQRCGLRPRPSIVAYPLVVNFSPIIIRQRRLTSEFKLTLSVWLLSAAAECPWCRRWTGHVVTERAHYPCSNSRWRRCDWSRSTAAVQPRPAEGPLCQQA